jgi:Membrane transporters of cations and cationic drugs
MSLAHAYLYLGIAIVSEVIATTALKASDGFTQLWPSVLTVSGYGIAFYCLALTLRVIPTGVAYAIWSGVGIVLISLVSWLLYKQELDSPAVLGMALIIAGVIVINLFSDSVRH